MHAQERTLIAKLGFQDADLRDPVHDAACRYVGEKATDLARVLIPNKLRERDLPAGTIRNADHQWNVSTQLQVSLSVGFEVPLHKGHGQYQTTIGFVDVVLNGKIAGEVCFEDGTTDQHLRSTFVILVEVKIARESIGNCLRQIRLYDSYIYSDPKLWVLASPWPIDEQQVSMLDSYGVKHVRLGPDFESYLKRASKSFDSPEI